MFGNEERVERLNFLEATTGGFQKAQILAELHCLREMVQFDAEHLNDLEAVKARIIELENLVELQ